MAEGLIAAVISLIVSTVGSIITARRETNRLREEMRPQSNAELAIKRLLADERWKLRSFDAIKGRVGGFDDNELRRLLLACGAYKWVSPAGEELWGLMERNEDKF